jgi:hypothetical protein
MPYGVKSTPTTSTSRTTYATTARYRRAKAVANARFRKRLFTKAGRAKAIKSNARAITKLRKQMYGPVQTQSSVSDGTLTVVADSPILFQVNNPMSGPQGAIIMRATGGGVRNMGHFTGSAGYGWNADDAAHVPNGPKLLLKSAMFKFKFQGFVDNTKIRIDFIRQKSTISGDAWNPLGADQFLPHTSYAFRQLCGFTSNYIDRSKYEVITTKHLYMNSRGSANPADVLQDRNTTDATTSNIRYCNVYLKLNKVCKQLDSSVTEDNGNDDPLLDAHNDDGVLSKNSYDYTNQHPLSNIWCFISTDDQTAFGSIVDGDSVKVDIIRKLVWRDRSA